MSIHDQNCTGEEQLGTSTILFQTNATDWNKNHRDKLGHYITFSVVSGVYHKWRQCNDNVPCNKTTRKKQEHLYFMRLSSKRLLYLYRSSLQVRYDSCPGWTFYGNGRRDTGGTTLWLSILALGKRSWSHELRKDDERRTVKVKEDIRHQSLVILSKRMDSMDYRVVEQTHWR